MLTRKMLRDMRSQKMQFVSIFLMAFLAVFIYAGVGGDWQGLRKTGDAFYAATNMPDIWIYGEGFSAQQVESVRALEGITGAERRLQMPVVLSMEGSPTLDLLLVEDGDISRPYSVTGDAFDITDKEGIWIDDRFASSRGLAVGDTIAASVRGIDVSKVIRGTIYSSEYIYASGSDTMAPDFHQMGYAYLSIDALPFPKALIPFPTLLVTAEAGATQAIQDSLRAHLDGKFAVLLTRNETESFNMFENEITQHRMMGAIFPVAFFLIALLTLITTIERMVASQRMQIGVLYSLGFSRGSILRHYMSYAFVLTLLGAALGLFTGPALLPPLFFQSLSSFYTLPEWKPAIHISFYAVAALLIITMTLSSYISISRRLRGVPAETLRPKAPKAYARGAYDGSRWYARLPFQTKWNMRDTLRNKVRSFTAILGVFACTALLVCAFSMQTSTARLKEWQYETIDQFATKIALPMDGTQEAAARIKADVQGEGIMEGLVEVRAGDVRQTGALLVLDDTTLLQITDEKQQAMALPAGGVSMSRKMAGALGLSVGDTFSFHIYTEETWRDVTVAAIHMNPLSQGIAMQRETLEGLGEVYRDTAILAADRVDVMPEGAESLSHTADNYAAWDGFMEAMNLLTYLLIAAAAVLSIVVLYNLSLLSFTERVRELATLKVLGFSDRILERLLLSQNMWFSAIGYVLGIPAGLWLVSVIVEYSGDALDFPIGLAVSTLGFSFLLTFGFSMMVHLLFSKRVRRIDMVSSLKAVE